MLLLSGAYDMTEKDSEDSGVISKFRLPAHKTSFYCNDIKYRQMKMWNKLPRTMSNDCSKPMFQFLCKQFLINKRKSLFVYY